MIRVPNRPSERNALCAAPVAAPIPATEPDYNAEADVWAGVAEALRMIAERKRAGGRGWSGGES